MYALYRTRMHLFLEVQCHWLNAFLPYQEQRFRTYRCSSRDILFFTTHADWRNIVNGAGVTAMPFVFPVCTKPWRQISSTPRRSTTLCFRTLRHQEAEKRHILSSFFRFHPMTAAVKDTTIIIQNSIALTMQYSKQRAISEVSPYFP